METATSVVIVGIISALVVAAIFASMALDRRRTRALGEAARGAGCTFDADATFFVRQGPGSLPLFQRGHSHRFTNLVQPHDDANLALFELRYSTGGGEDESSADQVVFAVRRRGEWPTFELRPEGFFQRVGQALLNMTDFDFPEHPIFSKRYVLRGPDEEAVRSLFQPDVIAFFESEPGWFIEADHLWLVAFRERIRMKPRTLPDFVERGRRLEATFR